MVTAEISKDRDAVEVLWGSGRRMSDFEAMTWRAEIDPRLRSDALIVDILETAPEWGRLVEGHEWSARVAPRLRQRVVEDSLRVRPPAWVPTTLDLTYHLSRVRVAEGEGLERVLELAALMHMSPLDPARPLWQGMLVEGLPDGRAAYLFKIHHAMTDGVGLVQLFDLLHNDSAEPRHRQVEPPRPVSGAHALSARPEISTGDVARGLRSATRFGVSAVRGALVPRRSLDAWEYAQSLGRVTKVPGDPSPLFRTRGLSRRMRCFDLPLKDLRDGARAAGGSLNDAYLAGLVGGLRYYHQRHGAEFGDLPIGFPVSLRKADQPMGGNQFGGACIAAPTSEADPYRRVQLVRERALAVREEKALNFIGAVSPVMSRLPAATIAGMTHKFTSSLDLQASNIPGLNRPAYFSGARIERMYGFGPVPGGAIMTTLLSHDGTCCVGIAMDSLAVPDPDVLAACFEEGLNEIADLRKDAP